MVDVFSAQFAEDDDGEPGRLLDEGISLRVPHSGTTLTMHSTRRRKFSLRTAWYAVAPQLHRLAYIFGYAFIELAYAEVLKYIKAPGSSCGAEGIEGAELLSVSLCILICPSCLLIIRRFGSGSGGRSSSRPALWYAAWYERVVTEREQSTEENEVSVLVEVCTDTDGVSVCRLYNVRAGGDALRRLLLRPLCSGRHLSGKYFHRNALSEVLRFLSCYFLPILCVCIGRECPLTMEEVKAECHEVDFAAGGKGDCCIPCLSVSWGKGWSVRLLLYGVFTAIVNDHLSGICFVLVSTLKLVSFLVIWR